MVAKTNVSSRQGQKKGWQAAPPFQRGGAEPEDATDGAFLGEINDSQEALWRRTLPVFDESHQQYTTLSLFPGAREIPAESSNRIHVKLSEMEFGRLRALGNGWLGCELWRQLRLRNSGKRNWRRR